MRVFIGLDVSLAKTAVCVVDHDDVVQWQGKVPSEPGPLIKRQAEWSGIIELVGIEACPLSEWLHRGLREEGIPVECIFAARVLELLEMAALKELSAAIEPLLRVREAMRAERKAADRTLAASARRSGVGA
jgi:hypothetical protein